MTAHPVKQKLSPLFAKRRDMVCNSARFFTTPLKTVAVYCVKSFKE